VPAMDERPPQPWMRSFELVTVLFTVLCILSVVMIVVFHLFWRSACFSTSICA
jgi:hypothetical protein